MMTNLLDVIVLFIALIAFGIGRIVLDLWRPVAVAFGCILRKVCVVSYLEIRGRYEQFEQEDRIAIHLRREVLREKAFLIGHYVRQMMWNTRLFQQAVLFEKKKIDPRKSGLDYDQQQVLVLDLVEETGALRWQLWKCQLALFLQVVLKLNAKHEVMLDLLRKYKKLEEDIVALAGMAEDNSYRDMLMERLGLMTWGLINGHGSETDPA